MYNNRRGRKWDSLRKAVLKGQAWKWIKVPSETPNKLEERFPGCRCELAEVWRLKLMEFGASSSSSHGYVRSISGLVASISSSCHNVR
jgi:hypothetical protein